MAEPKPIASLTSGLLARKGSAQPAMRRPMAGFGRAVEADDLGWNDMGYDRGPAAPVSLTPMPVPTSAPVPPVVVAREELAERLGATIEPTPTPRRLRAEGRKAAFTLRLEAERHLRLRLACTIEGRSAQQIVTQALDQFLKELPEIDRLASTLPRDRGHG
jgi:hypothetical protein